MSYSLWTLNSLTGSDMRSSLMTSIVILSTNSPAEISIEMLIRHIPCHTSSSLRQVDGAQLFSIEPSCFRAGSLVQAPQIASCQIIHSVVYMAIISSSHQFFCASVRYTFRRLE